MSKSSIASAVHVLATFYRAAEAADPLFNRRTDAGAVMIARRMPPRQREDQPQAAQPAGRRLSARFI